MPTKKKVAKKTTKKKVATKTKKESSGEYGFTGQVHSDETRKKISDALKAKYKDGHKPWNAGTAKKKPAKKKVAKKTTKK